MNKNIIFIASCVYSGSTVLELLLTSNQSCVGIGEAFQIVDPRNPILNEIEKYKCACGSSITECELWGDIIGEITRQKHLSPEKKYSMIYQHACEKYGKETVIIDSSKVSRAMKMIAHIPDLSIKVIHLSRDVRAFWMSSKRNGTGEKESLFWHLFKRHSAKGLLRYLKRNTFYIFQHWYKSNKDIIREMENLNLESLTLNYEDLCLNTGSTLRTLSDFVGFEVSMDRMNAKGTHSHNIFGNRLRWDPEKRHKLIYDYHWFMPTSWILPSIFMPHVLRYNRNRYRK